ncbi:Band 7 domain containing protein [uncultured Caudovirales phage]|uniref:Band 7 domain containing protein n=1 Tax=uncultured Caudovirales phage TaxID=2100421 RepID=A0A6J5KVY9_9CAUD|nr:Band 7 domain containing protein [uncultured Caudovirales phage]
MNRILVVVVGILVVLGLAGSCKIADSAEVALVVDQIGTNKGVPNIEMASGFIFYFPPTQDVFMYPTSVQHKVWTASADEDSPTDEHIDVTSADGATFGLDVAINLQLQRARAAELFIKYRVNMEDLINTRVRTIVRKELIDQATGFASDSLLQHRNVFEAEVNKALAVSLDKEGFSLNNLAIIKMQLPPSYKQAIERKIAVLQETATIKSQTIQAEQTALKKVALAKGNYEAAQYDAKTKEILSQPKILELYRAETARIRATNGTSEYGSNNVFGSTSGILLNRN